MKNFAYRFKELRLENDMTQGDIANKFNNIYHTTFNKSTISQYENGKRKPDISILENWAEFFDVSIDFLLGHIDIKRYNTETTTLTDTEQILLDDYRLLNTDGQKEANKRVKELTLIPFYKENNVVTLAAHNDHLNDAEEKDKIMEDFDDMDKW